VAVGTLGLEDLFDLLAKQYGLKAPPAK
jgi:hypothetical protein